MCVVCLCLWVVWCGVCGVFVFVLAQARYFTDSLVRWATLRKLSNQYKPVEYIGYGHPRYPAWSHESWPVVTRHDFTQALWGGSTKLPRQPRQPRQQPASFAGRVPCLSPPARPSCPTAPFRCFPGDDWLR